MRQLSFLSDFIQTSKKSSPCHVLTAQMFEYQPRQATSWQCIPVNQLIFSFSKVLRAIKNWEFISLKIICCSELLNTSKVVLILLAYLAQSALNGSQQLLARHPFQ